MMEKIQLAFQDLLDSVIAVAPKVVVGILLVIVALVFAKAVQWVLRRILTRLKFDDLVARVGIDKTLQTITLEWYKELAAWHRRIREIEMYGGILDI